MTEKAAKLFKWSKRIVAAGVLIAGFAIFDGTFFRGFGEEEFIALGIFYLIFVSALLYTVGYIICMRLPPVGEITEEPKWFIKLYMISKYRTVLIAAFGLFNAITDIFSLFSRQFFSQFITGALAAFVFMLAIPIIPTANMIIILYLYRKKKSESRN
jgi:hypothetical protein